MSASVEYVGYEAKVPSRTPASAGLLRRAYRFLKVEVLFNTLLWPYGVLRHRGLRRRSARNQHHTYTCFMRSPVQLQVILGPVLRHVVGDGSGQRSRLDILLFASSNGAEAYTLASSLCAAAPHLDFHIRASDLHQEMVDRAREASYSVDEVLHSPSMTDAFIEATFDRRGDRYVVKPEVRERVSFSVANLLAEDLTRQFAPADIVVAQNVLFHLPPASAEAAFANLAALLKPRAALLIDGMDLDLRVRLTRAHRLQALADRHREIYDHGRSHVALHWWRYHYGSEPYSRLRRDRVRRYSSIFLKAPTSTRHAG